MHGFAATRPALAVGMEFAPADIDSGRARRQRTRVTARLSAMPKRLGIALEGNANGTLYRARK